MRRKSQIPHVCGNDLETDFNSYLSTVFVLDHWRKHFSWERRKTGVDCSRCLTMSSCQLPAKSTILAMSLLRTIASAAVTKPVLLAAIGCTMSTMEISSKEATHLSPNPWWRHHTSKGLLIGLRSLEKATCCQR